MYRYDPIEHCKWCGVDYNANERSIHCPHRPKLAQVEDNIRRMRLGLKTEMRNEQRGETDVRTCLSCAICELSAAKSCCGSGFCDLHYAMHIEVAARFHHGTTSELLRVARMALQQFEFTYGKQKRGWDAVFLMDELKAAITNAEAEQRDECEQRKAEDVAIEDRCMFCGGKTAHEPDCSHGRPVAEYYCPDHQYNPPPNSGIALCPQCEITAGNRGRE